MPIDTKQLASRAAELKTAGKFDEAIALYRQIVAAAPSSAVAEHNLAAAFGDAGRWREADPHIAAAFAKGINAPETWLVRARCDVSLGRLDDAERAFVEVLRRRPTLYSAQSELAQLRWMRTGDPDAALAQIEEAIAQTPGDTDLIIVKAKVLEYVGRTGAAYALLAAVSSVNPDNAPVAGNASQLAAALGDGAAALALAERAIAIAPSPVLFVTLISACLAAGQVERASALAETLRRQAPEDQHAIALQATAWRLLGDPRYRSLYDYSSMVSVAQIDTPPQWPNLSAYIADLAGALKQAHAFNTHPFYQSIRHGSQVSDVFQLEHPAVAALPQALDGPIRRHIAALGRSGDPLRARNLGGYAYQGTWSIRMKAGGFHIDHVHPKGWLSSALYIEVPDTARGKEGWLKFGEPGIRTTPALEAEHFVQPAPGTLALFPSYMWHGTVPFTDTATRMTVAFDLAPAQPGAAG